MARRAAAGTQAARLAGDEAAAKLRERRGRRAICTGASASCRARSARADLALDARRTARCAAHAGRAGTRRDWTLDQAARVLPAAGGSDGRRRHASCAASTSCAARPTSANWSRSTAACRCTRTRPATRCARPRACARNMKVVFEAVAHRNPYPAEQLAEAAWNQMVLKALFIGSALAPDRRARPAAPTRRWRACCATTRTSAGPRRAPISPELWRCVGPVRAGRDAARPANACSRREPTRERAAAALALGSATDPDGAAPAAGVA